MLSARHHDSCNNRASASSCRRQPRATAVASNPNQPRSRALCKTGPERNPTPRAHWRGEARHGGSLTSLTSLTIARSTQRTRQKKTLFRVPRAATSPIRPRWMHLRIQNMRDDEPRTRSFACWAHVGTPMNQRIAGWKDGVLFTGAKELLSLIHI